MKKSNDDLATLSISLQHNTETPIYRQLIEQIRILIKSGRLQAGECLPSSRKLAQLLKVSRTSTLNAYEQLTAEGLLISRPASGTFVSKLAESLIISKQIHAEPISSQKLTSENIKHLPAAIFDAGADVEMFPFADWARALSKSWRRPELSLLRDYQSGGYYPLRESLLTYVKRLRGIDCHPEQIIVTAGNRDALSLIAHCRQVSTRRIALEEPCYPPIRDAFIGLGAEINYHPVDRDGMRLGKFSSNPGLVWMTPARQYPLGITMTIERRLEWLSYAQKQNCWLVEDDYDSEFQYRKSPLTPLFQLEQQLYPEHQRNVIYVGSLSKVMFRTLRIGFIIVPVGLIEHFKNAQKELGALTSVPIQPALAEFLTDRKFVSHMRRMRQIYQQRQSFLQQLILERLGEYLDCDLPDAGMHLLAKFKTEWDIDDKQLEKQLNSLGVFAPALSRHYHENGHSGLLLGFSAAEQQYLRQGVELLRQQIKIQIAET